MDDIDIWFSSLSREQKLLVLGYYKTWDYEKCHAMTIEELIVIIEFPPKNIDNTNSKCPIVSLYDFQSLTDDIFMNTWNEISTVGKKQIRLNIEGK